MATKLISKEEAAAMPLLPFGHKHPVRILIAALKPGELLHIDSKDFNWKGKTPNFFCLQISRATGAKFRVFKESGKTGWVVERVE